MTEGDTFLFGGKVLKFLNISEKGVHVALTKDKRPKIPSYAGGRMPLTSELASQVKKLISKKQSLESYPEQIKDWLILQSQKSILPMHDKVLIERKMPGLTKSSKQILFNTDLIYDVLKKHEGNHLLLKVAKEDSLNGLISIDRLGKLMKRIQNKILFKKLEKISPLAVPLLLEINRETINKDELNEYYLEEFENELLREIGFS